MASVAAGAPLSHVHLYTQGDTFDDMGWGKTTCKAPFDDMGWEKRCAGFW